MSLESPHSSGQREFPGDVTEEVALSSQTPGRKEPDPARTGPEVTFKNLQGKEGVG